MTRGGHRNGGGEFWTHCGGSSKSEGIKNVIKGLMGEKVDLRYEGNFVVDIVGVNLKIPFEYEEKVGFGVNYE